MRRLGFATAVLLAVAGMVAYPTAARACDLGCCLPDNSCENVATMDACWSQGGIAYTALCDALVCGGSPLACRVTGGGNDTSGSWDGTFASGSSTVDRYTFGGQAGAPTANQPQPYGEWTHHQQRGPDGDFVFHAGTASAPAETKIVRIECSDPGACLPALDAPAKQIDFVGVGSFKNIKNPSPPLLGVIPGVTFHWFEVHIEDLGEPGKGGKVEPPASTCPVGGSPGGLADCDCPDFYTITIHADSSSTSAVIYRVGGYITGGNLQIHPPIN